MSRYKRDALTTDSARSPALRVAFERVRFDRWVRRCVDVTFHGVRGSTPCHGEAIARYGGNTSCVSVRRAGSRADAARPRHRPALLRSCATQDQPLPRRVPAEPPALGPPAGSPVLHAAAPSRLRLDVYAPSQDDGHGSIAEVVAATIRPPLFPVNLHELGGAIEFTEVGDSEFAIGDLRVTSREVPHVGRTCGYRIDHGGSSIAYISDHQQPVDGSFSVSDGAMELCRDVDLLIHDAQYTAMEFETKRDWGHCMIEYAVWLAGVAGEAPRALPSRSVARRRPARRARGHGDRVRACARRRGARSVRGPRPHRRRVTAPGPGRRVGARRGPARRGVRARRCGEARGRPHLARAGTGPGRAGVGREAAAVVRAGTGRDPRRRSPAVPPRWWRSSS